MIDDESGPVTTIGALPGPDHNDTIGACVMAEPQPTPTQNEQWRDVPDYEGLYQVSDHGRVASVSTNWRGYGRRIMSESIDRHGYLKVRLTKEGKRKKLSVHRLVCEAFRGSPERGEQVCHINGVPTDNRLGNLRWGTGKDNAKDRDRHGTTAIGDRNANSVLTVGDIPIIRELASKGVVQRVIAEEFGVSQRTIWDVLRGRTWNHVV